MPTHSAWVLHELYVREERTLIQKDQLASRSCQRCLRSGSHRHCCGSAGDCSRAYAWSRSPLHDVRQHARFVDDEACGMAFTDEQKPGVLHARSGGARRDRTDDLLLAKQALSQLSYGPGPWQYAHRIPDSIGVVGLGRLELPTSRLSSARSNQLSYKPKLLT